MITEEDNNVTVSDRTKQINDAKGKRGNLTERINYVMQMICSIAPHAAL